MALSSAKPAPKPAARSAQVSLISRWFVKPDCWDAALEALNSAAAQVLAREPDTLTYRIHIGSADGSLQPLPPQDRTSILFFEVYRDADAFRAHSRGGPSPPSYASGVRGKKHGLGSREGAKKQRGVGAANSDDMHFPLTGSVAPSGRGCKCILSPFTSSMEQIGLCCCQDMAYSFSSGRESG